MYNISKAALLEIDSRHNTIIVHPWSWENCSNNIIAVSLGAVSSLVKVCLSHFVYWLQLLYSIYFVQRIQQQPPAFVCVRVLSHISKMNTSKYWPPQFHSMWATRYKKIFAFASSLCTQTLPQPLANATGWLTPQNNQTSAVCYIQCFLHLYAFAYVWQDPCTEMFSNAICNFLMKVVNHC